MLGFLRQWRRRRYMAKLVDRGLVLGDNVELNDGFFLDPSHCFLITIEDGVTFGPNVQVFAHDASCLRSLGKTRIGLVRLRRNCFIGGSTVILPGVTVGENSIIGANSTVSRSVPANQVWAGSPATKIMSVADYVAMLAMRRGPDFLEESYRMESLTTLRRKEIIEALETHRIAFMVP
jgi:maltose O-acetyltransferase